MELFCPYWRFSLLVFLSGSYPPLSEILYDMRTNTCGKVRHYDLDGIDRVRDMDKWSELNEESNVWYERCISKAYRGYESTNPPSQTKRLLIVITIDLVLIGLGWLSVWGCVVLGRWVHRGFAAR